VLEEGVLGEILGTKEEVTEDWIKWHTLEFCDL
jgi:hypothetical protein